MLLLLLFWTIDRIEPPYAVLVSEDGQTLDVAMTQLPTEAVEGDRLLSPTGPIQPGRAARLATLKQRIARMAGLETQAKLSEGVSMGRRRQDHFARQAKQEGFRARSIYKLEEIDRKVRLFQGGQRVLDLGCAPGSWTQYAAKRVGRKGSVVGIDLQEVASIAASNVQIIQGDAFETPPEILLGDGPLFDLVISDMAPATSGNRFSDHVRSVELCRRALTLSTTVLRPGGAFVCKVFEGEDLNPFVAEVRELFAQVKRIKPKSVRTESVELFVVGLGRQEAVE